MDASVAGPLELVDKSTDRDWVAAVVGVVDVLFEFNLNMVKYLFLIYGGTIYIKFCRGMSECRSATSTLVLRLVNDNSYKFVVYRK